MKMDFKVNAARSSGIGRQISHTKRKLNIQKIYRKTWNTRNFIGSIVFEALFVVCFYRGFLFNTWWFFAALFVSTNPLCLDHLRSPMHMVTVVTWLCLGWFRNQYFVSCLFQNEGKHETLSIYICNDQSLSCGLAGFAIKVLWGMVDGTFVYCHLGFSWDSWRRAWNDGWHREDGFCSKIHLPHYD